MSNAAYDIEFKALSVMPLLTKIITLSAGVYISEIGNFPMEFADIVGTAKKE